MNVNLRKMAFGFLHLTLDMGLSKGVCLKGTQRSGAKEGPSYPSLFYQSEEVLWES